jgi:hypothetical protein
MKFPATTEGRIKLGIVGYGIAGCVGFAIWGGLIPVLNFSATFLIVAVNFIYLEALTRKVVQKNPGKGALVLILGMLRYPLIGLLLYAIVSWRYFLKIPAFAGLTAVVFALVAYPLLDGGNQKDASGSLDSDNVD